MGKYCCFTCPSADFTERALDDPCPACGDKSYRWPLQFPPQKVREFKIIRSLGRGFYGATFIAQGDLGRDYVIKVTPVEFYNYFKKPSFEDEVKLHVKAATNAEHIVNIANAFTIPIEFSDAPNTTIECHIQVLDYVEGNLLKDYVDGSVPTTAAEICQITIDLLRIHLELEANNLNHNDLHSENLIVEKLKTAVRRSGAIAPTIRVKAIDLGSLSDHSKSTDKRLGDIGFIADHIGALIDRVLLDPLTIDDRDSRIALALQSIVLGLRAPVQNARLPNFEDLITQIEEAYHRATLLWKPWTSPFSLRSFGDHYNAQTLESWNVPKLLVDPDRKWVAEITKPGPQIITGMRGCGKTMLLRALDIHARMGEIDSESKEEIIKRVKKDKFIGLFVSAQRLLEYRSQSIHKLEVRISRLFLSYALQASRALLHLKDVDDSKITFDAHRKLGLTVANFIDGTEDLRNVYSLEELEHRLTSILVQAIKDPSKFAATVPPGEMFNYLADQLRNCSEVFHNSTVFFLLDDVSTRYLEIDRVGEILSALLFQSPICAFKFTSEWQTVELGLQSPGREHPIREGRDTLIFDLGADVFRTITAQGNKGKDFVSLILQQRAKLHSSHPRINPKDVLGDVNLETIAREIGAASETSEQKKKLYRGLTCLTNVCVGDIGDIIKLYEDIIKTPSSTPYPISAEVQSLCFRDLSSRRLFDLSRRDGYLKDHALAFARASHKLLMRSFKNAKESRKGSPRLRQYSSIYIRITAENENTKKQQIDRLRELIDASVFVYSGGAARTKTRDSNPTQQFILSYRKIYGLNAYIGIADRDRFELSGKDLEEWLENPKDAEKILLRNQIQSETEDTLNSSIEDKTSIKEEASDLPVKSGPIKIGYAQKDLFEIKLPNASELQITPKELQVKVTTITPRQLKKIAITSVVTGLGFEDRTLASNQFLSEHVRPEIVHAAKYSLPGKTELIKDLWKANSIKVKEFKSSTEKSLPARNGLCLIDVSGLSKPIIFKAVLQELHTKGRVLICHVAAKSYYPLPVDLEKILAAEKSGNPLEFIERLAGILMGEKGPYEAIRLMDEQSDPSRNRALIAYSSPKHERLFSLLDKREFDFIEVFAPASNSPRNTVSRFAADFVCKNYNGNMIKTPNTDKLFHLLMELDSHYLELYNRGGFNIELGLTGSKMQAVASAILASQRKIAQTWYLSPNQFDEKRFTKGVGKITIFDIKIPSKYHVLD
jgi:hypothetical protein